VQVFSTETCCVFHALNDELRFSYCTHVLFCAFFCTRVVFFGPHRFTASTSTATTTSDLNTWRCMMAACRHASLLAVRTQQVLAPPPPPPQPHTLSGISIIIGDRHVPSRRRRRYLFFTLISVATCSVIWPPTRKRVCPMFINPVISSSSRWYQHASLNVNSWSHRIDFTTRSTLVALHVVSKQMMPKCVWCADTRHVFSTQNIPREAKKTAPFYFCNSFVRTSIKYDNFRHTYTTINFLGYHPCILYSLYNQREREPA